MQTTINPVGGLIIGTAALGTFLFFGLKAALGLVFVYGIANIAFLIYQHHQYKKHYGSLEALLGRISKAAREKSLH